MERQRKKRKREKERVLTASDKNAKDYCKEMKYIRAELRMAYQRDKELCLCPPNMPKWVLLERSKRIRSNTTSKN